VPMVEAIREVLTDGSIVTADAGYHSEANLKALDAMGIDALIADNNMRARDERFATQGRHKQQPDPLYNKYPDDGKRLYQPRDFQFDPQHNTCICPAGKALYSNGHHCTANGRTYRKFTGAQRDCMPCGLRAKCLRTPDKTPVRQVAIFHKAQASPLRHTEAMKQRIDSPQGRVLYGRRFAIVEPVFGNLRHNKGLNRFTLRGRIKVDVQWKLFCLVHNIEKLAHHGYAQ
jgi:hypothetical protein